jgi:hypothetical protein
MKVLLAGISRAGTTWAYNVLGRAAATRRVYEPDGPYSDVLGAIVTDRLGEFPVLRPGERSDWYRLVWDVAFSGGWPWDQSQSARAAGRRMVKLPPGARDAGIGVLGTAVARLPRRHRHVVVKTVNSVFSLEWLCERYRPSVVVMHRNPINTVSSWMALNLAPRVPLESNGQVLDRVMRPLGIQPPPPDASPIGRCAWTVGLLMTALKTASEKHPEWLVVSHDHLSEQPRQQFRWLHEQLGLEWTEDTDRYLALADEPGYVVHHGTAANHPNAATTADPLLVRRLQQSTQWKRRLTHDQVGEAREVLAGFPLGDWASGVQQPTGSQR